MTETKFARTRTRAKKPARSAVASRCSSKRQLKHLVLASMLSAVFSWSSLLLFPSVSLVVLAVVIVVTSVLAFLIDGRQLITPAGIYFLASGLFIGIGLLYLATRGSTASSGTLALVASAANASTIVILALYVRWRPPDVASMGSQPLLAVERPQLRLLGVAFIVTALLAQRMDSLQPVSMMLAYAGVMLLATVAITRQSGRHRRGNVLSWALAFGAGIAYFSQSFTGSGRLTVAGMAVAAGVAYNNRKPYRWHKVALLVLIVPALSVAGAVGAPRSTSTSVLTQGSGLASLYAPLETFAKLVELDTSDDFVGLPRRYGATFFTSAAVWVPREIWPSKPLGLGAQIAEVLHPQYRDGLTGHSDAALLQGEFFINFGWVGLAIMGPLIAGGLAFLARSQAKLLCQPRWTRRSFIVFTALLSVVASIADLVWGGSFTWAARGGLGAALLLLLAMLLPHGRPSPSLPAP